MRKVAWLFPGQGAQYPGMGRDFFDAFPVARQTFEEADDLLGEALSRVIFEGPQSLLTQTFYSQLGILTVSTALFRVLLQQIPDLKPAVVSGLSLGEYTALCASERLSFAQALHLVQQRARFMSEACEREPGTMAAVLGFESALIEEIVEEIEGVWIANYNCPGQIVISGTMEGVERASAALKEEGAKRIAPLAVHGAFHSGLMRSAEERLFPFIEAASLRESSVEFVMNVPGNFVDDVEEIQKNLIWQITHPVRWMQGVEAIEKRGLDLYLEIGCGKTLSGMNRKIGTGAPIYSLEKSADLDKIAKKVDLVMV